MTGGNPEDPKAGNAPTFKPPGPEVFKGRFAPAVPPTKPSSRSSTADREEDAFSQVESGKDYAHRKIIDLLIDENGEVRYAFLTFVIVTFSWLVMLYQDNSANSLQTLDGCFVAARKAAIVGLTVGALVFLMTCWRSGALRKASNHVALTLLAIGAGGIGYLFGTEMHGTSISASTSPATIKDAKIAVAKAQYDLALMEAKKPEDKK